MSSIKKFIWAVIFGLQLIAGLMRYSVTGKTPPSAHLAMIFLFCRTGGWSNDFLSWIISRVRPPYDVLPQEGMLKLDSGNEGDDAIKSLEERGFYVFKNRLPDDLCDRLLKFSTSTSCLARVMEGGHTGGAVETVYSRDNATAVRYDFSAQDLLENADVQKILADLSFASVAQRYLKSKPLIDVISMWWHTDFSDKPDSEAAQYFHFDMDRPKWLKFFIYLTDVTSATGAHFFVAGSHKSGGIPSGLLSKGYARLSDDEVADNFVSEDVIEFVAPRGTILVEDTRGLHKGKHVERGDRLMFQVQFSNSMFGADYPKAKFSKQLSQGLKDNIARFPELYSAYL